MSKFKVGDKVRIVKHRPHDEPDLSLVNSMVRYLGQETTITKVLGPQQYTIALDHSHFNWHEKWLESSEEMLAVEAEAQAIIKDAMRYRSLRKLSEKYGIKINHWNDRQAMFPEKLDEILDKFVKQHEATCE